MRNTETMTLEFLQLESNSRPDELMTAERIPVFKPLIEREEIAASREALELGWLGMGSYVGQFEDGLKSFLEADDRYVVAVSTGHAALHLALLLMGVGSGDEVIT